MADEPLGDAQLASALKPVSATFRFGALQIHLDLSGLAGGWVRYTLGGSGGEWEVRGENLSGRTSREVESVHLDGEVLRGGVAVGTVEAMVETELWSGEASAKITLSAAGGTVHTYEGPVAAWDDALTQERDGGAEPADEAPGAEDDAPGGLGKLFG